MIPPLDEPPMMGGTAISEYSHHALVTGGSQGIGFAVARTLLEKGYRVTIGDVREVAAKNAAEQPGRDALAVHLDAQDGASIEVAAD